MFLNLAENHLKQMSVYLAVTSFDNTVMPFKVTELWPDIDDHFNRITRL